MSLITLLITIIIQAHATTIKSNLNFKHQDILEPIAEALYSHSPELFHESCLLNNSQYNCGEIPFGSVLSDKEKELIEANIPSIPFNKSGFKGTMPATSIAINMSRNQKSGAPINQKVIGEDSNLFTHSYFGRDFLIRIDSNNSHLGGLACVYIPGFNVNFKTERSQFTAKKKVAYFFSAKVDISIKVVGEKGSFDAARTCFGFKINPEDQQGVQIITRTPLELLNLKYPKLDIDVSVSGGNFLGSLVKKFAGGKIEDAIQSQITKKFNKEAKNLSKKDILSGQWMPKIFGEKIKVVAFDKFDQSLFHGLKKSTSPHEYNTLSTKLGTRCQSAISKISKAQKRNPTAEEESFCSAITQFKLSSYRKDKALVEAGCYSHYFRIDHFDPLLKKPLKPPFNRCSFNIELTASVAPQYKDLGQCLIDNLQYHSPKPCFKEIENLSQRSSL